VTSDKIKQIRNRMKAAQDRQKMYANKKRKPIEFQIGDKVMLKVSPWKGVVRFGKRGKLSPRYVGLFEIVERVEEVAYRLSLPEELRGIHPTFHVANFRRCLAEADVVISLDDIRVDEKLTYVEEPEAITDRKVKKLRTKEINLVKFQWKFHKGQDSTWESEDEMRTKYPSLFNRGLIPVTEFL